MTVSKYRDDCDEEDSSEEEEEGVRWRLKGHASIGMKVAAYFPPLERVDDLVPSHGVMDGSGDDSSSSSRATKKQKTESQLFIGMLCYAVMNGQACHG